MKKFFAAVIMFFMANIAMSQAYLPGDYDEEYDNIALEARITHVKDIAGGYHQALVLKNMDKRFGDYIKVDDVRINYGECSLDQTAHEGPGGLNRKQIYEFLIRDGWHPEDAEVMADNRYIPEVSRPYKKYIGFNKEQIFAAVADCDIKQVDVDVWVSRHSTETLTFKVK